MGDFQTHALSADLRRLVREVLDSDDALERFSTDFGQMVRKAPAAVVRPGSAAEVQNVVRYAAENGIPVAPRGTGRSLSGQSLTDGGIVLDMAGLSRILEVRPDEEWFAAQAGASWAQVVEATAPLGVLPTVLPGCLDVSIGGTLSTVGWGASSFRYGAQLAQCDSLDVVTGTGELVRCGREENSELFLHALGGLGRFGVITAARQRLRHFRPALRTHSLAYRDLDALLADADIAAAEGLAVFVGGMITRVAKDGQLGPWRYLLSLSFEGDRLEEISDEETLGNLLFPRRDGQLILPTLEQLGTPAVLLPEAGKAQPWVVLFLPRSQARRYVEFCLANLPLPNLGGRGAIVRVWPGSRRTTPIPMLQLPEEEDFVLFAIEVSVAHAHLAAARTLLGRAIDLGLQMGARCHPGAWIPFDEARWKLHFGDYWPRVEELRRRFDPAAVLGPRAGAATPPPGPGEGAAAASAH